MKFYDAHAHFVGQEAGGFLVGLEGEPWFEENSPAFCVPGKILHNDEAEELAKKGMYRVFRYVRNEEVEGCELNVEGCGLNVGTCLKYHPRREKYSPEEVIESIRKLKPRAVMIDTLNEPGWVAYDYWKVARAFPELPVFLPHAGGYLINDFIKICHFQKNVWIDFTLTHTNFGGISKNPLAYVDDAIRYALNGPFKDRVLMGSDLPFFDQMKVVEYYERLGAIEMLNENFERAFDILQTRSGL